MLLQPGIQLEATAVIEPYVEDRAVEDMPLARGSRIGERTAVCTSTPWSCSACCTTRRIEGSSSTNRTTGIFDIR